MQQFSSVRIGFEGGGPWTLPNVTDVKLISGTDAVDGDREIALLQLTFAATHPVRHDKPLTLYLKLSAQQAADLGAALDSVGKLRDWPAPRQGMALEPRID